MFTITQILNQLAIDTSAKPNSDIDRMKTATTGWQTAKLAFSDNGQASPSEESVIRPSFDVLKLMDANVTKAKPQLQEPALANTLSLNIQSLVSNLVLKFKEQVLEKYFAAFFPGQEIKKEGVSTLVDDAFVDSIVPGGLAGLKTNNEGKLYQTYNTRFQRIQAALRNANAETGGLEYFQWLDLDGVIAKSMTEARQMADHLKGEQGGFNKALVMGMGGSSQFPKIINNVFPQGGPGNKFKLEVMDGTDSASLKSKFNSLAISNNETKEAGNRTAFVIISKSGGTFEVMHVIQSILDHLTELHGGDKEAALKQFAEQAVFITEPDEGKPKPGALRELAKSIQIKTGTIPKVIEHPNRVGGRYSFLTAVGMLPAALKGLDVDKFKEGAQAALSGFLNATELDKSEIGKLALLDNLAAKSGKFSARFIAAYTDRLAALGGAKEQLAGESNSKGDDGKNNGVNALPVINTTGPLFQHSTIEGLDRNDKHRLVFEQVITKKDQEDMVHGDHGLKELNDFARKSLHQDTVTKLALPLAAHLRDNRKNPVITTILDEINEYNVGYILMRDMLATVVQAGLQKEDPSVTIDINGEPKPRTLENNIQRAVYQDGVEAYKKNKSKLTPESLANVELAA